MFKYEITPRWCGLEKVYVQSEIPLEPEEIITQAKDLICDRKGSWFYRHDNGKNNVIYDVFITIGYKYLGNDKFEEKTFKVNGFTSSGAYFTNKPEAIEFYKSEKKRKDTAEKQANIMLDKLVYSINSVLSEHGASIGYCMDGDTHGIYNDYQYVSITVDGFYFERCMDD